MESRKGRTVEVRPRNGSEDKHASFITVVQQQLKGAPNPSHYCTHKDASNIKPVKPQQYDLQQLGYCSISIPILYLVKNKKVEKLGYHKGGGSVKELKYSQVSVGSSIGSS